jgi:hypothetical protein
MPGSWAIVRTTYGEGRVALLAPHPELDNQEFVITNLVYWLVEEQRKKGLTKGQHIKHWTKEELFFDEK